MTQESERVQLTVITQEIEDADGSNRALSTGNYDAASAHGGAESSDGEGDIEIEHVGDEGSTGNGGLLPTGPITFDIRKRTLINIYQRTILEEFYRCGMISASLMLNHLHTAAAEKTGLEITVVKNWIRNRRRPTAVKSAEKFAEKIAHGNLPPIPTIPNVPSLSSIGLPTTSNLCSESAPSSCASTNSALNNVATDTGRTLASHLMPEAKRLRTESGPSPVPVHIPVTQTHHHKQPTSQQQQPHLTVSLQPSSVPLTTAHLIHTSPPILSQTHHSTLSSVAVTTNSTSHGSTHTAGSNTTSGRSSPASVTVITNGIGTLQSSLLVKVRISGSGESDFVEVDVPSLTYSSLLKSISEELEVTMNEITKIRKLPNVWIRKDRDVQRLKEGQELEVIVKSGTSTVTTPPPPPITSILAVNPFSMAQSHSSTNAFSLLSSATSAHSVGHHGGTGLATLRTDSDGGLLSALTSDGPVSMPDLSNVGGANGRPNGLH